jgi:predicted metal-binding membrane protein
MPMPDGPASSDTRLERGLEHDRALVFSALAATSLLAWAWIVPMARDMAGSMDGPAGWMMTSRWDAVHVLLLFAMWTVMMVGMMLPSTAPTLLLYTRVVRSSDASALAGRRAYLFATGYLGAWTAFAALATVLQRLLTDLLALSPMMTAANRGIAASLLLIAGAYQLTPLKGRCLEHCRTPAGFIARHWRRGDLGALRMGWDHGLFCVGCCWALMLLLFAGGVMNLSVIFLVTAFVLVEKLAPFGVQGGRLSGVLLAAAGLWMWRG